MSALEEYHRDKEVADDAWYRELADDAITELEAEVVRWKWVAEHRIAGMNDWRSLRDIEERDSEEVYDLLVRYEQEANP